jgi:hypothetical protein
MTSDSDGGLVMAVDRIEDKPQDCDGCNWTYWGDRGKWRLTYVDPACPVHGRHRAADGGTA